MNILLPHRQHSLKLEEEEEEEDFKSILEKKAHLVETLI
jgi:hypothetical protein